ncbi:dephospho-CoA kinase [Candidatus Pacearchaeota archaeon]|nr:dephospho-CoA kinase [Candidatus Pacearchaeota archaeon]
MIIGLTGLIGSGKGAVSDILVAQGFKRLAFSDLIIEEVVRRGQEITRSTLVSVGNELRQKEGLDIWAKKIISLIKPHTDYVIEGFRSTAEVLALQQLPSFFLLGVSAGRLRRWKWIAERGRAGDPHTYEQFLIREKIDFLQSEAYGQQNALCFCMADRFIVNEGSFG